MKINCLLSKKTYGFTLLEMSVVILVLLTLAGLGMAVSNNMRQWQLGRAASEDLRSVYSAQRMYLADNPTTLVANLNETMLIPYLPNRGTVAPASLVAAFNPIKSLKGDFLGFDVTKSPPVLINLSNNLLYDPSGSLTDSLWDVGQ
jgi:prepilin-type N-terminal cleavage/methylation domain-containing protein